MSAVLDDLRRAEPPRVDVTLEKLCLTPHEAAAVLSVGLTTLYELLKRGEISSISIGRARRIPLSSLRSYVAAELERAGSGGPGGVCQTSAEGPSSRGNVTVSGGVRALSRATSARNGPGKRGPR